MGLFNREFRLLAKPNIETACKLYKEGVLNLDVFFIFDTKARNLYKALDKAHFDLNTDLKRRNLNSLVKETITLDVSDFEFMDISSVILIEPLIITKELDLLVTEVKGVLKKSEGYCFREYTKEQEELTIKRLREYSSEELRYISINIVSAAFSLLRDINKNNIVTSLNSRDTLTYSECLFTLGDALHGYPPLFKSTVTNETFIEDFCNYNQALYTLQTLTTQYLEHYSVESILSNFDEHKSSLDFNKLF